MCPSGLVSWADSCLRNGKRLKTRVRVEKLRPSFLCYINVGNEGFAADSRLPGRHGWCHVYGLLGCGPDEMLKPYSQTLVRKKPLLWYDLRASCGFSHLSDLWC